MGPHLECGKAATQALRSRIASAVSCTHTSTDRYSRAIGHCSVGDQDLNAWLVRNGWALAYYTTDYVNEETQAKAARRGIHRGQYVEPSARRQGERLPHPPCGKHQCVVHERICLTTSK